VSNIVILQDYEVCDDHKRWWSEREILSDKELEGISDIVC